MSAKKATPTEGFQAKGAWGKMVTVVPSVRISFLDALGADVEKWIAKDVSKAVAASVHGSRLAGQLHTLPKGEDEPGRWVLVGRKPDGKNCPDCLDLHGQRMTFGTFLDTKYTTVCGGNCRCDFEPDSGGAGATTQAPDDFTEPIDTEEIRLAEYEAMARDAKDKALNARRRLLYGPSDLATEFVSEPAGSDTFKEVARLAERADLIAKTDGVAAVKSLTRTQKDAIERYTASTYSDINAYLRGSSPNAESWVKSLVKNMDKAFAQDAAVVNEPFVAWRGIDARSKTFERLTKMKPGDIVHDKAFSSATISPDEAFSFATRTTPDKGAVLEITVAPGTRGMYLEPISQNPTEMEWLIDRESRLKITEITKLDWENTGRGKTLIRAILLPEDE